MNLDFNKIQEAWNRYVAGPEPIPEHIDGVRQEIVESWRRSKGKADPFLTKIETLSTEDMDKIWAENSLLTQIAFPYLKDFYKFLKETNHNIMLSDKNGFQLLFISEDQEFLELSEQAQLFNGCDFSESSVGTNGIGISLANEAPSMVLGPEHFLKMYHPLVCYASPIYDTSHNLIGTINITGPLEAYQPYIMGMLGAAISGIEKEFKLTQTNNMLKTTLDSFNHAVLLLGADKSILHFNDLAPKVLGLEDKDLIGQPFSSVIQMDSLPDSIKDLDKKAEAVECTLLNKYSVPIDVSLTITPKQHGTKDLSSTLLILNTQKALHSLANRMAGFSARYTFDSIVGTSAAIQTVKSLGQVAAEISSPVLIFGENGTGKEVLAQAIHNASNRRNGPFVWVNCNAIPKGLMESEFFGYEGGAFDGEKGNGHPGKFELADEGTLFLDEVHNLSLDIQALLLQVLKTKEIVRMGGKRSKTVNARILASTSVSLQVAVQKRTFREDLYYLLNVLNIVIPPLRERTEDIKPLLKFFGEKYSKALGKEPPILEDEALQALITYSWPGNVRELESVVEHTLNMTEGTIIGLSDLPDDLINYYYAEKHKGTVKYIPKKNIDKTLSGIETSEIASPELEEYNLILAALQKESGNVKLAAASMNMPLSTFYRKLNKYNLDPKTLRQVPYLKNS
ncbi:MAG: sigma-54-dependent Fis family transcriptional regulator [Anaerovoracaceae bacterium]|jgi:transcriptional regulator of acetoin/glycerol metabolism